MVILLLTILHLVYDWARLASSNKAMIPLLYFASTAPSWKLTSIMI